MLGGTAAADGWQDFSPDAKSAVRNAMFTKSNAIYESAIELTVADLSLIHI